MAATAKATAAVAMFKMRFCLKARYAAGSTLTHPRPAHDDYLGHCRFACRPWLPAWRPRPLQRLAVLTQHPVIRHAHESLGPIGAGVAGDRGLSMPLGSALHVAGFRGPAAVEASAVAP